MAHKLIEEIEKKQMKSDVLEFNVGDTIRVDKVIVEGKKERIQQFEGIVLKIQGAHSRLSFTVRKVVDGVGVEKSYLLHSPLVPSVKLVQRGVVRRARLHYLRDRIGSKATRVKVRD